MNRLIIIAGLTLIVPGMFFAQINWTEHTIDSTFNGARSVFAINLDGDDDIDILGAAGNADVIAWWENDGNQNFTKDTIATLIDGAISVFAINLDSDDDIDVLGAARGADDIIWWENDGNDNFTERTIDDNFDGAASIFAINLDGDDDNDVLGAAGFSDDITWWENDGGSPPNFTERTIDGSFDGARSVFAIDLDGDTDIDVLGAATGASAGDLTWWENDGGSPPNFTEHTIDSTFSSAWSVYAIDINGDSAVDVLSSANTWWENDGGSPPNFTEHAIDSTFPGARSVFAIDLDDDTDIDVLSATYAANYIAWWENDGGSPPNFTEHVIADSFFGAWSVYAIDLDGDGDVDVLGAANNSNCITWWESDLAVILDVGTVSIDIDSLQPESTTLSPQATVKNMGSNTETFDVSCEIDPGAYSSTETVTDLASGNSMQVTFSPDFTFATGSYTVKIYTKLADDTNPANDTLEKVIDTYDPGVSEGSLDIPKDFMFSAPTITKKRSEIGLALPQATKVNLVIYDVLGRLTETVISKRFSAGNHTVGITLDLPAGIYFYYVKTTSGEERIQKFILLE